MSAVQPALFKGIFPSIRQVKAKMPEKPYTPQELKAAERLRTHVYMGCPHEPNCQDWRRCVQEIAWYLRQTGKQVR